MAIFLVLNALSVAFLVYVLVNFWKDGHRSREDGQASTQLEPGRRAKVITMEHWVSHLVRCDQSVIPMRARTRTEAAGLVCKRGATGIMEIPVKRIPA